MHIVAKERCLAGMNQQGGAGPGLNGACEDDPAAADQKPGDQVPGIDAVQLIIADKIDAQCHQIFRD